MELDLVSPERRRLGIAPSFAMQPGGIERLEGIASRGVDGRGCPRGPGRGNGSRRDCWSPGRLAHPAWVAVVQLERAARAAERRRRKRAEMDDRYRRRRQRLCDSEGATPSDGRWGRLRIRPGDEVKRGRVLNAVRRVRLDLDYYGDGDGDGTLDGILPSCGGRMVLLQVRLAVPRSLVVAQQTIAPYDMMSR
jgi:hypothetical protein